MTIELTALRGLFHSSAVAWRWEVSSVLIWSHVEFHLVLLCQSKAIE